MPETSNKYYLLGVVSNKKNEGSQAIYYSNHALGEFNLKEEDIVPFEYIKAEAFEILGDIGASKVCLERILSLNPSFRDAREKYRR